MGRHTKNDPADGATGVNRIIRRGLCAAAVTQPVSSVRCSGESWASKPNSV